MNDDKSMAVKDRDDSDRKVEEISKRDFWQTINPGYVVAGLSALTTSWLSISRNYHKILAENHVNADAVARREKAYQKVLQGTLKHPQITPAEEAMFAEAEKKGTKQVEAVFEKIVGARDRVWGTADTLGRWKFIKPHHKWYVALNVVTITSIALGAIYSFGRERKLADRLNRQIAQRSDTQENQR